MSNPASFHTTFDAAKNEYRDAWNDQAHTRFELPPVNVNKVLRDRYRMKSERRLTSTLTWEMETKKAWDPLSYIPYVVSEGQSWGPQRLDGLVLPILPRVDAARLDLARAELCARRRVRERHEPLDLLPRPNRNDRSQRQTDFCEQVSANLSCRT